MKEEIAKCVRVIRSAFGEQLEIHLPSEQDTEDCLFFHLNARAKVNVFVEQEAYQVCMTAFYGKSDSAVVTSFESIPEAIERLYKSLIGPNGGSVIAQPAEPVDDAPVEQMTEWNSLMMKMKADRIKNQSDTSSS